MVEKIRSNLSKKQYLFCLILIAFATSCRVDILDIAKPTPEPSTLHSWSKIYGGTGEDVANKIEYLPDQGAVIIGTSLLTSVNENFILVLRVDKMGNKVWVKSYGNLGSGQLNEGLAICSAPNGFMLAGTTQSCGDSAFCDIYIAHLNKDGDCDWQKSFGTNKLQEIPCFIKQTSDGNFIVGATVVDSLSSSTVVSYLLLMKLKETGEVIWQKKYERSGKVDKLKAMDVTADEYILTGQSYNSSYGIVVLKINGPSTGVNEGNVAWQKLYDGSGYDSAYVVKKTSAGGYILGGYTNSPFITPATKNNGWLLMLDTDGSFLRHYTLGIEDDNDDVLVGIQEISDGFIVMGRTEHPGNLFDTWIGRLNILGDQWKWRYKFGGSAYAMATDLVNKDSTHFLITGCTANAPTDKNFGQGEFWAFNINDQGDSNELHTALASLSSKYLNQITPSNQTFAVSNTTIASVNAATSGFATWSDPSNILSETQIPWATPTPTPSPTK